MSKAWIKEKRPEFMRDILRDFCLVVDILESQFAVFDQVEQVSFDVLHDLVGVEMNKGLLWRLKDTAHHLLCNEDEAAFAGQFLDWCVGYIFHEAIKIKEDAYQQQTYAPRFRDLLDCEIPERERLISRDLFQVLLQTNESIRLEAKRVRFFFGQCRKLFTAYLAGQAENILLARFIFEHEGLVRKIFGQDYDGLVNAIYGQSPHLLYVKAAQSLRQGGWMSHAAEAVDKACALAPRDPDTLREKEIIDIWRMKAKI